MASKGKGREKYKLVSTANTGHFYTTSIRKGAEKKLEIKKFDPRVRRHVIYKQTKMK